MPAPQLLYHQPHDRPFFVLAEEFAENGSVVAGQRRAAAPLDEAAGFRSQGIGHPSHGHLTLKDDDLVVSRRPAHMRAPKLLMKKRELGNRVAFRTAAGHDDSMETSAVA